MKKVIFGMLVLSSVFITSCKKSSSNPGGFWTFKSTTYNATTCTAGTGELDATNLTSSNTTTFSTFVVGFYNGTLPTTGGQYTVANNGTPTSSTQVGIQVSTDGTSGNTYESTGGNGTQKVTVSVSNGKVSVSGSGITVGNVMTSSDSAGVNFSITQLQ